MKQVAGIVLKDKKGHILSVHATKHPDHRWGVPKGRIDKGESPKKAAIREFREETGIDLRKFKKYIKKIGKKTLKGKVLHLFGLEITKAVKGIADGKEIDGLFWVKLKDFKDIGEKCQVRMIK